MKISNANVNFNWVCGIKNAFEVSKFKSKQPTTDKNHSKNWKKNWEILQNSKKKVLKRNFNKSEIFIKKIKKISKSYENFPMFYKLLCLDWILLETLDFNWI